MANGSKLVLSCVNANGDSKTLTFSPSLSSDDIEASDVQTLAQAVVTNGQLWSSAITEVKGAKVVDTVEKEIDLE